MNKKVLTLLGSVALLLVIGTLSGAVVFAGHSGSSTKGTVKVHTNTDNTTPVVKGANATLKMNDEGKFEEGFSVTVSTKDLDAGNAYSLWFSLKDAGGANQTIVWANGGIAGNHGQLSLAATFPKITDFPPLQGATVPRRNYTAVADTETLSLVIVRHGPPQFSLEGVQQTTRPGGCTDATSGPGDIDALEGTFACINAQSVTFP
jgi:hypothetical protein